MSTRPDDLETVTVVCPTCGTPLHPRVGEQARKVRCPDCYVPVSVPSLADVLQRRENERRRRRPQENPGTYRVAPADDDVGDEAAKRSPAPFTKVICPICQARLHPDVREQAYRMRCPDCHEPVDVPALKDIPAPPRKARRRIGRYRTGAFARRAKLSTRFLEVQAEIRQEAIDPPPRWTFFSDVLTFPWSEGVWPRWALLSCGCSALLFLLAWTAMLSQSASGPKGLVVAFFVLPLIWITLWTASYAAALCLPIVIDTAAGMNRVANWPDPVWKEWMAQLIYVAFLGGAASAAGYGAGTLSNLYGGGFWFAWGAATFLLFPLFLLSSLEADSPFMLLSGPILRTLGSAWWCWLSYYGLSGLLIAGLAVVIAQGAGWSLLLMPIAGGPLTAATVLIAARLLGRLAWRALVYDDADDAV